MLVLASTVTIALPRLPQHATNFREVEVLWLKWEARVTFIVYTLTFACIMFMHDFGKLSTSKCARIVFLGEASLMEEGFLVPLLISIICLGILYLLLLELYTRCWPELIKSNNNGTS